MKSSILLFCILLTTQVVAQQNYYDVTASNGNGFRFWNGNNNYKIHFGNGANYQYGPVQDYSIKMNMNGNSDRGWTWGVLNQRAVAALNTQGRFQISGWLKALSYETHGTSFTKTQIAEHSYSGSHGILFNAYKQIDATGSLSKTGNTKYANNVGSYSDGAGAIMFFGNGGTMQFLISPVSTGKGTNVNWGTPKMVIKRDGKVGIGKRTPAAKLHVNGNIIAEEIKVEDVTGADFVFDSNYALMPLSEIEAFIKANHHLPDVPSAAEMQANGIELGKMNMLLLQKIEELTLHVIQLQKRIDELEEN